MPDSKGRFVIALAWPSEQSELAKLSKYISAKSIVVCPNSYSLDDYKAVTENADAIVGFTIPQSVVDHARHLKIIQVLSTGIGATWVGEPDLGFSVGSLKQRGILLGDVHVNAWAVAEHAFALLLTLAKRIFLSHHAVSNGEPLVRTPENFNVLLSGKTIGIIGLGAVGLGIARIAKQGFDMRVVGVKRDARKIAKQSVALDFVGTSKDLLKVMGESDFVVIAAPLTSETENMVGERELRAMKRSAYLINVSRATIVQEKALKQALVENWIGGYGSDVWYPPALVRRPAEGMSAHFCVPSWEGIHKLPNVVGTGTRATYTPETIENVVKASLENVDMLANGRTPKDLVDLERTY